MIDRGAQPILLIIGLDHGLVERNVIRTSSDLWLEIDFGYPVVKG